MIYIYLATISTLLLFFFILRIKKKFDYLDPAYIFILFFGANYLIAPYMLLTTEISFLSQYYDNDYFEKSLGLVTLSLISFIIAYSLPFYKIFIRLIPIPKGRLRNDRIFKVLIISFFIFVFFQLYHIFALGGFSSFMYAILTDRAFYKVGFGHIIPFTNLAIFIFPLAMILGFHNKAFKKNIRYLFLFIALICILTTLIKLARFNIILSMAIYYIAYHLYFNKKPNIKKALTVVTLLIFALFFLRDIVVDREFDVSKLLLMFNIFFLQTFSSFEMLLIVATHYPENYDFFYGKTILEVLTYPYIPRIIWETKPLVYGSIEITEEITNSFLKYRSSSPPSFIGESYANGGYIVVIFSMFFHAIFIRTLYEGLIVRIKKYTLSMDEKLINYLIYAVIYLNTIFIIRIGFSTYVSTFLLQVLPIIIIVWLIRKRFIL